MFSIWPKQLTDPIRFCVQSIKFTFLYLIPVVSAGLFVHFQWQRRSSPLKALLYVHIFVSRGRQLCSLLYPVCQLHHVCSVDAEEDVQDFRLLRPGLESLQVVVSFLTSLMFSAIVWSGSSKISYLTCKFILRFLQIQLSTAYWRNFCLYINDAKYLIR